MKVVLHGVAYVVSSGRVQSFQWLDKPRVWLVASLTHLSLVTSVNKTIMLFSLYNQLKLIGLSFWNFRDNYTYKIIKREIFYSLIAIVDILIILFQSFGWLTQYIGELTFPSRIHKENCEGFNALVNSDGSRIYL